jgi:hypothetical protein
MALNGGRLAALLELAARSAVTICRSQSVNVLDAIFTGAQVAGAIFLVCAGSNVQLHVWPVAAHITAANSMRVFGCGRSQQPYSGVCANAETKDWALGHAPLQLRLAFHVLLPSQLCLDEHVDITIHDILYIARFRSGAVVLHHLVRLKNI